ncbi:MAG: class I adenylate-forming enzyme family protein [Acidimicrobiales bacterium]
MPDLVALDLPAGPQFVQALTAVWGAGDAAAPIDQRLPLPARERVLAMLKPAWVQTPSGRTRLRGAAPVEEGDALVMTTSGSEGEPKGVVLTHSAVAASAKATSARLGADPARHRWLACLPLSHVGGLAVVTRAILTGAPLSVLERFDETAVMAEAGPEVLVSLVPAALRRTDPARFYKILLGGSAAPPDLPPNVVTTYGMTETGSGVVYDGVALDGAEVRVTDGQVHLRGPMLLRCYRDGSVPLDKDGWLPTGDAGEVDANGRLKVMGRLSDLIITGGENVWPVAIERVIRQHKGVAEVAVSSRPDREWGERVVACVVPADAANPPRLEELRALVKEQVAPFAAPRELVLVESLPKTSLGKLRRRALRAMLAGGLGQRGAQLDALGR